MTTRTNTTKSTTTKSTKVVVTKPALKPNVDSMTYATAEWTADTVSQLVAYTKNDLMPEAKQMAVDAKAGWKAGWNTDR